jgi:uncharacterized protein
LQQEISSVGLAESAGARLPGAEVSSISSLFGAAAEQSKSFWFNINAELVLYGSTEPDAKVTIGSREIKLRPDGTFSYRFALPDGQFPLEVRAVSADGQDGRAARLQFSRATHYSGDVGAHPQDSGLKIPSEANVG